MTAEDLRDGNDIADLAATNRTVALEAAADCQREHEARGRTSSARGAKR
jgi:hypothetical protein